MNLFFPLLERVDFGEDYTFGGGQPAITLQGLDRIAQIRGRHASLARLVEEAKAAIMSSGLSAVVVGFTFRRL